MKYFWYTMLIFGLGTSIVQGQNFAMDGSNITSCGGTFTDSGDLLGDYSPNENFTTVICPDGSGGSHVQLEFSAMELAIGDTLFLYDSDMPGGGSYSVIPLYGLNPPLIFAATAANPIGCITAVFQSNADTVVNAGWQAAISCIDACQLVEADITFSDPAISPAGDGYINLCPGEILSLDGAGIYAQSGLFYDQSDATSIFRWDMGNGDTLSGQSIQYAYDDPGGYYVNLLVEDVNGCTNFNFTRQRVRVAGDPVLGFNDLPTEICAGDTINLDAIVNTLDSTINVNVVSPLQGFSIGGINGESLKLPDGTGVSYETTIDITAFNPGDTVINSATVPSVCLNIEHSYMHDLDVFLICPSGESVQLVKQSFLANRIYLGDPVPDFMDNNGDIAGVGADYCFTADAAMSWIDFSAMNGTGGIALDLPPGDYLSFEGFGNLVGCPLNGQWTLRVIDRLAQDNGWVFNWSINFDPTIFGNTETFQVPITDYTWEPHPTAINVTQDDITINPQVAGNHFYTFSYSNEYGCEYETEIPLTVLPPTHPTCGACCPPPFDIPDQILCPGETSELVAGTETVIAFPIPFANYYQNRNQEVAADAILEDVITTNSIRPNTLVDVLNQLESVCINLENPSGEPINLSLRAPDGTTIDLVNGIAAPVGAFTNTCFSPSAVQNINAAVAPYTGDFLPVGNFNDFIGSPTEGDWTLIIDNSGNAGTVRIIDWTITFSYQNDITYNWMPSDGLSCDNCPSAIANPAVTTSYYIEVTDSFGNMVSDSVTIFRSGDIEAPVVSCVSSRDTLSFSWPQVGDFDQYEYRITLNGSTGDWEGPITGTSLIIPDLNDLDEITLEVRIFSDAFGSCTIPIGSTNCIIDFCGTKGQLDNFEDLTCNDSMDGLIEVSAVAGMAPFSFQLGATGTPQANGNFGGLGPGDYTVFIVDADNCQDSINVSINQPAAINLNIQTLAEVQCAGTATGELEATATGGTGTINFAWSGPVSGAGPILSNVPAGNYTILAQDANGCNTSTIFNLPDPSPVIIDVTIDSISCNGANDGAISFVPSGGTGSYNFEWSDANTSTTRTNLTPGIYNLILEDDNLCRIDTSFTLLDPEPLVIDSIVGTDLACFNDNSGQIIVHVSGGTQPIDYLWDSSPAQTDSIATMLSAGTYSVQVTDANGCQQTAMTTIGQPPALDVNFTIINIDCRGTNTGAAFATPIGGVAPYSYNWGNGNTFDSLTMVPTGNYPLTLTDANGCQIIETAIISEPPLAIDVSVIQSFDGCHGESDKIAIAMGSNGIPNYSFEWSDGQMGAVATGLTGDSTYTVIVTDQLGCQDSVQITIFDPTPMVVTIDTFGISCFGGSDGSLSAVCMGGAGGYTFEWVSLGAITSFITDLDSGEYCLNVTDANGCTVDTCITLSDPPIISIDSLLVRDVTCSGDMDGEAIVAVSGGRGVYDFSWDTSPVQTDSIATGLAPGTYTVTIQDELGCTADTMVTVNDPGVLAIDFTVRDVACLGGNDGAIFANGLNGTPPYSYDWGSGNVFDSLSMLTAGTYTLTITDANNCTAIDSVMVGEPLIAISATAIQSFAGCNGAADNEATVSVMNGTPVFSYQWSDNQMTETAIDLPPGNYSVTVTDQLGCQDSTTVTVADLDPIQLDFTTTEISCQGATDGGIQILPTGGIGTYSYLWDDGDTQSFRNNLGAGTYCVTVTDTQNCMADTCITLMDPILLEVDTIYAIDVTCFGDTDGQAIAIGMGGTGALSYSWDSSPVQNDSLATGLAPGPYTVVITDERGCQVNASTTVGEPGLLSINFQVQNVVCLGGTDGSILASGQDGTAPYSYDWGNGNVFDSLTMLTAGMYTVTVTDANGCVAIDSAEVIQPNIAITVAANQSFSGCAGAEDNEAMALAADGTAPYTYVWSDSQMGATAVDLAPGTYAVTVTDQLGCQDSTTVNVVDLSPISLDITTTDISCNGGNDGSINIVPSGGAGNYSFLWGDGNMQGNRDNLSAGTYCVTVSDAQNCVADTCIDLSQPALLQVDSIYSIPASCSGFSDGQAIVIVSGGTGPLSFVWNDTLGQSDSIATGLSAGIYQVDITDQNGCTTNAITVVEQPLPLSISFSIEDVNCLGEADGSLVASGQGGTEPYNYDWGGGNTQDSLGMLLAGTYTVTVTDNNGCIVIDSATVIQPLTSISVAANQSFEGCAGLAQNQATAVGQGGSPGYTYLWDNGQTDATAINLAEGNYSVTITDSNGCQDSTQVMVFDLAPLVLDITVDSISCANANDGAIFVNAQGGTGNYTFNWNDGNDQNNRDNLGAATYCITVTDNNGCQTDSCITLNDPPPIIIESIGAIDVSCFGQNDGSAFVVASGGVGELSYMWDDDLEQILDTAVFLVPNTYEVVVTDERGCSVSASILVEEPDTLVVSFQIQDVSCQGGMDGQLVAQGQGGTAPYSYAWDGGPATPEFGNLSVGNYTVTVTDANECMTVAVASVTEPQLAISLSADQSFNGCFGEENNEATAVAVDGNPTYNYSWEDGQTGPTATGLAPGTYSVTVTDQLGCQDSTMVTVNDLEEIDFFLLLNPPSCAGLADGALGVTQLTGGIGQTDSDYFFNWSTNQTSIAITGLAGGQTYSVTVSDAQGCQTIRERLMPETEPISFDTMFVEPSCFGGQDGSISLSNVTGPNSGFSFQWDANAGNQMSANASGLGANSYQVTITDNLGCENVSTLSLGQPEEIAINITVDNIECFGARDGVLTANVTGGTGPYTYDWSNGETSSQIDELAAGTYNLTVRDANGCEQMSTATIIQTDAQEVEVMIENAICFGDRNGSITVSPTGGTGPYSYSLDNVTYSSSPTFIGLSAGDYNVFIRDSNGCITVVDATIEEPAEFTLSAGPDQTINIGDSLVLRAISTNPAGDVEIVWFEPYEGTLSCTECPMPFASPEFTIDYEVVGIDANGCEASDIIRIFVEKPRVVAVPTGFTPNNDGVNDRLLVHGLPNTRVKLFRVFDRWGELLYENGDFLVNDPLQGWDGRFRDQDMNGGVYIWQVIVEYPDGVEESFRGETTLIR